ncbi:MAG: transposase [Legionellaceae bacterium]|nr:transposase [Legionellaceae bacterium]
MGGAAGVELASIFCNPLILLGFITPLSNRSDKKARSFSARGERYLKACWHSLVSSDMHCSADRLYEVYQKRWRIEEFHKSIKQNASLEKSPTKKVKTQCNHMYASMIAYCKLEMLKFKTGLNHFAIKYKLVIRANQIAMQELNNMTC